MILTDRKILKLNLWHPTSSLVVTNPNSHLAVAYEISVQDFKNEHRQTLSSNMFGLSSFQIEPKRGIILPKEFQLIKISALNGRDRKARPQKKVKRKYSCQQYEVGKLEISCSYFLQYNKQKIIQSFANNTNSALKSTDLPKVQNIHLKLFIQTADPGNHEPVRGTIKNKTTQTQTPSEMKKQAQVPETLSKSKGGSFVEKFKQNIQRINLNTLTSSNYIKDLKKDKDVRFENPKLNEDYDLIRNKLTLSDFQKRKSNEMLQHFEEGIEKKDLLVKQEDFGSGYLKVPPTLQRNNQIDESIIVKSYKPKQSRAVSTHQQKINNKSFQIIVLAIIAAVFVSLGANLKMMLMAE